jgi:hypothetical protein
MEEGARAYPKLLNRDPKLRETPLLDRDRSYSKPGSQNALEPRGKQNPKGVFRALEEEHRLINLENMQMLGLTIQKVSYAQKSKKNSTCEVPSEMATLGLTPEVLFFQKTEQMVPNRSFVESKLHPCFVSGSSRVKSSKRPQSIRVRDNSSPSLEKRKRSVKPVNSDYANPVYDARIASYRELLFRMHWSYGQYYDM